MKILPDLLEMKTLLFSLSGINPVNWNEPLPKAISK